MDIKLFNIESFVISNENFAKVFILITIVIGFFKFALYIFNNFKLESKDSDKVLKIKRYRIEVLYTSFLYLFIAPISNYIILRIGLYIKGFITTKIDIIFIIIFTFEIIFLLDIYLINRVNTIIYKYNINSKKRLTLISVFIFLQYIIYIIITIMKFLNRELYVELFGGILSIVLINIFIFYIFKFLYYIFFNKLNIKYYADKIEIIIDTSFYYKTVDKEKIIVKNEFITNNNELKILGSNEKVIRTINREWIDQVNILRNDNTILVSLSNTQLQNTLLIFKKKKTRKVSLKNNNSKKHANN